MMTDRIRLAAGLALAVIGCVYLASKSAWLSADTTDFKFFWLAGRLWAAGESPYGPAFAAEGARLFVGLNPTEFFFYPPNWHLLSRAAAIPDYEAAGRIWRIASAFLLAGGMAGLWLALRRPLASPAWLGAAAVGYVGLMAASAIALHLGQSSPLVFLGAALFAAAYVRRWRGLMALALAILMLKPTIGLILACMLAPQLFWWRSLILGAALTLALMAPALAQIGAVETIRGFLSVIPNYGADKVNAANSVTGLRSIAWYAAGLDLPGLGAIACGAAAALGLGAARPGGDAAARAEVAALALAIALLAAPLHLYDAVIAAPILLLTGRSAPPVRIAAALALLMLWRAPNLARATGIVDRDALYADGGLLTTAAALVLVAALTAARARRD